jgi:phosphinothricin acetyltransferase
LVADIDGVVAGYAYASQHRSRSAYRWSADVTVYVAAEARRAGLGRALYGRLLPMLAEEQFPAAFAGIALPNPASGRIHEAMGFTPVGVYRKRCDEIAAKGYEGFALIAQKFRDGQTGDSVDPPD